MDNLELFNKLWNDLLTRWAPNTTSYSTLIDYKDVLSGNVPEILKATQANKPSPVSPWTFSHVRKYFPSRVPITWNWKVAYVGHTNSMEPFFDYGDMVFEVSYEDYKKQAGPLRIGQIAIYEGVSGRIIHRFIGMTSDGKYVFKGDNNFRPDPPVSEDKIIDVMIGVVHTWDKVTSNQD